MTDIQAHVKQIARTLSVAPENEGEISAFDYLEDALDIEYIISSKGEYLGARVLVAFGGPTIWVNTRTNTVEGNWWGDSASAYFVDTLGLDDALRELCPVPVGSM